MKNSLHDPKQLYIDLMKRCLANTIYEDGGIDPVLGDRIQYENKIRNIGADWPEKAHTMIGVKRLDHIHRCLEEILHENIPGDCIETGVWRGGATILMRAILKAHGDTRRMVWAADSFEGLPIPNGKKYPADRGLNFCNCPELKISLKEVKANFKKYNLLDAQVRFLKGFFSKTLPKAPIQSLSLLRLDGDLYESTADALKFLYPKLSLGGYIIIDDYHAIGACAKAVNDYRQKNKVTESLMEVDGVAVYWKKLRMSFSKL